MQTYKFTYTNKHSRINAFVLTAFASLPLVVVTASDFHFRKRWQDDDEHAVEEEEKESVSCHNDITISYMQHTARATCRCVKSFRFLFCFPHSSNRHFDLNKKVLNNVALKLELYTAVEMPDLQFKIIANFHLKYLATSRSSFKIESSQI